VTVQQVFDERNGQGQLIWKLSVIVDGLEIGSLENYEGIKQFDNMRLLRGSHGGHYISCFTQIENFHYEILDIGKLLFYKDIVLAFKFEVSSKSPGE